MNNKDALCPSLEKAKKEIVCFLSGDSFDGDKVKEAIHKIAQQAPHELMRLRQVLLEGSSECRDVVEEERSAWESLSQSLGKAKNQLVLFKNAWCWVADELRERCEELNAGALIGDFFMRSISLAAGRLGRTSEVAPAISLSTKLPDDAAQINLTVRPEHSDTENKDVWHIHLELDPSSRVSKIKVGLGDKERRNTGMRTLQADKPEKYSEPPPIKSSYWLYFEWDSIEGKLQEHKVEIPLRPAVEGA